MRRRRVLAAITGVVLIAGAASAAIAIDRQDRAAGDDDTPAATATGTGTSGRSLATVERRDLTREVELDGTIGHGDRSPLALSGDGTLTQLPSPGQVVRFGEALAEVDGAPVLLMEGDRPAWRSLGPGTSDGADIEQLEAALVALGAASTDDLEVDDHWTADTTAAVKRLQQWLQLDDDGRFDLGEIVFRSSPVRIASVDGHLGDRASAAGIEVTGLEQAVSADLPASRASLLHPGDTVTVELPTGEEVDATVADVGSPVVAEDGSATLPLTIDAGAIDVDDGVPVTVHVDVIDVEDALVVPAAALLALAEGGYAVEVPDASAPTGTRLVAVDIGTFADGWVQIDGDIAEGDQVVVP